MQKIAKTQVPVVLAYSSPFVLLSALVINIWLIGPNMPQGPVRLLLLSASFPIGLAIGRLLYFKRSHLEVNFDDKVFAVIKGGKEVNRGSWKHYKTVSIRLDQYGRPNLRLYKTFDDEFSELPISKTGVSAQEFRNYVQGVISGRKPSFTPRAVEAV